MLLQLMVCLGHCTKQNDQAALEEDHLSLQSYKVNMTPQQGVIQPGQMSTLTQM